MNKERIKQLLKDVQDGRYINSHCYGEVEESYKTVDALIDDNFGGYDLDTIEVNWHNSDNFYFTCNGKEFLYNEFYFWRFKEEKDEIRQSKKEA